MIGVWLLAIGLAGDPAALRQLRGDGGAVDWSTDGVSVAADLGPLVAATWTPGTIASAHVGTAKALVGKDRSWGVDAIGSVGLGALLATPDVALLPTGELRGGVRNDRGQATLGLVAPLGVQVLRPDLAVPLLPELRLAFRGGPLWLGCRGQAGAVLSPGHPPALRATAAGFVQVVPRS